MRYVAFLRGINVGGSHVVSMEALRAMFAGLGFTGVETFIASGNVIFETRSKGIPALERKIEKALEMSLGYEVLTFIRSLDDVARIAACEPFPLEAAKAAVSVNVGLFKEALPDAVCAAVVKLKTDVDDLRPLGTELYWLCVKGQGGTKIPAAAFARALKAKGTFRGMKTMAKLAAKYPA